MSNHDSEITNAAATGAAAAVAAVQNDQAEQERAAQMENATVDATIAAEQAAERAQEAASVAESASSESIQAQQEAASASAIAAEAAEAAYSVQTDMGALRQELQDRDERLINRMREVFTETSRPSDKPTEVVVSHNGNTDGRPADQTTEHGANGGSSGSATDQQRTKRHKFGR